MVCTIFVRLNESRTVFSNGRGKYVIFSHSYKLIPANAAEGETRVIEPGIGERVLDCVATE